eukprot:GHVT01101007.1.p2 GENE.GHVT01101007.1~~GHVT01101007.1.p2  ORF type:complete len:163 (+),score=17.08 GHVT01101007.1:1290-1778(+)
MESLVNPVDREAIMATRVRLGVLSNTARQALNPESARSRSRSRGPWATLTADSGLVAYAHTEESQEQALADTSTRETDWVVPAAEDARRTAGGGNGGDVSAREGGERAHSPARDVARISARGHRQAYERLRHRVAALTRTTTGAAASRPERRRTNSRRLVAQ